MDELAAQLEAAGGAVLLDWKTSRSSPDTSSMDRLVGTWRLIYSSGFNGGSLGGRRPGPPATFVPLVLGQIYQVINTQAVSMVGQSSIMLGQPVIFPALFAARHIPAACNMVNMSTHVGAWGMVADLVLSWCRVCEQVRRTFTAQCIYW